MTPENRPDIGNSREGILAFERDFGMRYGTFEETLTGLCRLTGELSVRWGDEGVVIAVPDLRGNSSDIIRLETSERSHFDVIKAETMRAANMTPSGDEEQVGNYIPVFGTRGTVIVRGDSISMTMRQDLENPEGQMEEIFRQIDSSR